MQTEYKKNEIIEFKSAKQTCNLMHALISVLCILLDDSMFLYALASCF